MSLIRSLGRYTAPELKGAQRRGTMTCEEEQILYRLVRAKHGNLLTWLTENTPKYRLEYRSSFSTMGSTFEAFVVFSAQEDAEKAAKEAEHEEHLAPLR